MFHDYYSKETKAGCKNTICLEKHIWLESSTHSKSHFPCLKYLNIKIMKEKEQTFIVRFHLFNDKFVNAFTRVYGEKYCDKIQKSLEHTTFIYPISNPVFLKQTLEENLAKELKFCKDEFLII